MTKVKLRLDYGKVEPYNTIFILEGEIEKNIPNLEDKVRWKKETGFPGLINYLNDHGANNLLKTCSTVWNYISSRGFIHDEKNYRLLIEVNQNHLSDK
ncbi:MAG: hypothetical protein AABX77_00560 [Nanoarchaeota archaeon]